MYNFNSHLFDDIVIPVTLEKETLVKTLLFICGENEVRFVNPEILKLAIDTFFKKYYINFDRICDAIYKEYEVIENYDRKESRTVERKENSFGNSNENSNIKNTAEKKVNAYNASNYVDDEMTTNDSIVNNSQNLKNESNGNEIEEIRSHGNIGVTTSQQMIQSEIELRKFNIYGYIASLFEDEITISIY